MITTGPVDFCYLTRVVWARGRWESGQTLYPICICIICISYTRSRPH